MGATGAIISGIAGLASGVVGYIGAQRQADAAENQAESAQQLAQYNAQIQRNNAVAQAGDENFAASVSTYNANASAEQRSRALRDQRTDTSRKLASAEAKAGRAGTFDYSFDDVLRSDALLLERQEVEILSGGAEERYQYTAEADLATLRGNRALEAGQTASTLTLAEGRNRAYAYRSQADSSRIGGYASLLSGVSSAAGSFSSINYGGGGGGGAAKATKAPGSNSGRTKLIGT
jgi:uncharacterized phage infection (PIP) family protein YhgE